MHYSFSTVLMTVITSNLLIILISIFLKNNKLLISVGYKLLAAFAIFTVLRFILPFEFPFTTNIVLPDVLSKLIFLIRHPFYTIGNIELSFWFVFEIIWAIGILVGLVLYFREHLIMRRFINLYGKNVTKEEPYISLLKEMSSSPKSMRSFRIIKLPYITSPMLYSFGIHNILLPEELSLSERDLYYVFCHEMSHHIHRDLWLKNLIRIIKIVYWWNPFCYLFKNQTDMILEMRVDESLTKANNERTVEYLHCLIYLAESVSDSKAIPNSLAVSFLSGNKGNLQKRFELLCTQKKSTRYTINTLFTCITVLAFMLSYTFIFEARHFTEEVQAESFSLSFDNAYAVILDNGTYDIYLNDMLIENVDTLDYYPADIPLYTIQEKEAFYETH